MEQLVYNKNKFGFLILNNTSSIQYKKCNNCNRKRKTSEENHQICHVCHKIKTVLKPKQSGNKVIGDFIRYTQVNHDEPGGKLEFVPYEQFKDIEFIAEGGFSKIYKATWIDGPINNWHKVVHSGWNITRDKNCTIVLKKLYNSKNTTSKELNEVQYMQYFKSLMQ
jgi:hypothetical protein